MSEKKELDEKELEGVAGGKVTGASEGAGAGSRSRVAANKVNSKVTSKMNAKSVLSKFAGIFSAASKKTEN